MLNLIWLKSLITVIEQHSFQAAASQLGLAQPTITQHIQKLEEMLKVSLIQWLPADRTCVKVVALC